MRSNDAALMADEGLDGEYLPLVNIRAFRNDFRARQ